MVVPAVDSSSLPSSALLLLPRELRDEIYQAVFARPAHQQTPTLRIRSDTTTSPPLPAVMRTCLQLYVEVRPFFVRSIRFVIHNHSDLEATQQWLNDGLWPESGNKFVQAVEFTSFEMFQMASPSLWRLRSTRRYRRLLTIVNEGFGLKRWFEEGFRAKGSVVEVSCLFNQMVPFTMFEPLEKRQ